MPVDKEDRPRYDGGGAWSGKNFKQWYCTNTIACTSKEQAYQFEKAIKSMVEKVRREK